MIFACVRNHVFTFGSFDLRCLISSAYSSMPLMFFVVAADANAVAVITTTVPLLSLPPILR